MAMTCPAEAKNPTSRVFVVVVSVLFVLFLYSAAWNGATVTTLKGLGSGFLTKAHPGSLNGSAQSSCQRNSSQGRDSWAEHPSVFTLEQLGLWQTSFLGVVPSRLASALRVAAKQPPKAETDAVLLQHWWRCRNATASRMHLRGVGSAYSPVDATYIMQLIPWHINKHLSAVKLTDVQRNKTRTVQQSTFIRHGLNAWHVEANDLSTESSYELTTATNLSKHAYAWDSSRCINTPTIFRPGSMWTVIAQAGEYDDELYARLLAQHTSYHQALGFTGAVLFLTRPRAAQLVKQPAIQQGLEDGSFVMIIWDGDIVPSMPYYYQYLWYNLVMLATWGVPRIKLAMIDPDEFYILPKHLTFTEAFKAGGCLHGYHQVRMVRHNAYSGVNPADAAACHAAAIRAAAAAAPKAAAPPTHSNKVVINILDAAIHKRRVLAGTKVTTLLTDVDQQDNMTLDRCKFLLQNLQPDILGLTRLGWQQFFQELQRPLHLHQESGKALHAEPGAVGLQTQQQQQKKLATGYIDQVITVTTSFKYAHKSVIDPNFAAAYAVHDANVMLHGGNDTKKAVGDHNCVFGIHLVNMYKHRVLGSGTQLGVGSRTVFDLARYIQDVVQRQEQAG